MTREEAITNRMMIFALFHQRYVKRNTTNVTNIAQNVLFIIGGIRNTNHALN